MRAVHMTMTRHWSGAPPAEDDQPDNDLSVGTAFAMVAHTQPHRRKVRAEQ
jgi:hypothetical protein